MRSVSSPSGVFPVRASFSILDSFYHLQVKFQPTSTIIFLVITMQLAISLISRNVCWNSVRAIYQGCWSGWRRLWSNNRQGSFRRWRSFCPSSNCNLCSGRSRYINRKIPRCIKCDIGRKREDNGVQEDWRLREGRQESTLLPMSAALTAERQLRFLVRGERWRRDCARSHRTICKHWFATDFNNI